MKPRLTDKVLRGLIAYVALAEADVEVDPGAWDAREHSDFSSASRWVRGMIRHRSSKQEHTTPPEE